MALLCRSAITRSARTGKPLIHTHRWVRKAQAGTADRRNVLPTSREQLGGREGAHHTGHLTLGIWPSTSLFGWPNRGERIMLPRTTHSPWNTMLSDIFHELKVELSIFLHVFLRIVCLLIYNTVQHCLRLTKRERKEDTRSKILKY